MPCFLMLPCLRHSSYVYLIHPIHFFSCLKLIPQGIIQISLCGDFSISSISLPWANLFSPSTENPYLSSNHFAFITISTLKKTAKSYPLSSCFPLSKFGKWAHDRLSICVWIIGFILNEKIQSNLFGATSKLKKIFKTKISKNSDYN